MRQLLSKVRRAVDDYNMINDGDKVAVGLSGGKDSLTLLSALAELRKFYPQNFEVIAITLDMGFPDSDFSALSEYCKSLNIQFILVKTEIAPVVFDIRKEKNPCSLCAKMRRGALHDAAKSAGCNKIALGHHFDDAVETFFLSLFYEGRISCFSPVTYLDRKDITLIRPLIYMHEKDIRGFARKNELPIYKNPCLANGNTQRQFVKDLLFQLEKSNRGLRERIFGAMCRSGVGGFIQPQIGRKVYKTKDNE
ncbi:MAG: ATP-binding protein [Bacillota bacterium]|nr:ATP-binding protein [Bacillota bacterium]